MTTTEVAPEVRQDILNKYKEMFSKRYAVLLHNDDHHDFLYVMRSLAKAVPGLSDIVTIVQTAHLEGQAIVIVCMKDAAELYVERIQTFGLLASSQPE